MCSTIVSVPPWAYPTRRPAWLLEIEFQKHETFAYASEAFRRGFELCPKLTARPEVIEEYVQTFAPCDDDVDHDNLVDILREAGRARKEWKHILARCAPRRERRAARSPVDLPLEQRAVLGAAQAA